MQLNQVSGGAAANGAATTTSVATSAGSGKVDYDSFLTLLVAQMTNQDPTQPIDSTQYVSQLATFSQVEQTVQTNNKLDMMIASNILALAESLIGNTVTSADGSQSGVIKSVRLTNDGAIALLKDGSEVTIGPGVEIE